MSLGGDYAGNVENYGEGPGGRVGAVLRIKDKEGLAGAGWSQLKGQTPVSNFMNRDSEKTLCVTYGSHLSQIGRVDIGHMQC